MLLAAFFFFSYTKFIINLINVFIINIKCLLWILILLPSDPFFYPTPPFLQYFDLRCVVVVFIVIITIIIIIMIIIIIIVIIVFVVLVVVVVIRIRFFRCWIADFAKTGFCTENNVATASRWYWKRFDDRCTILSANNNEFMMDILLFAECIVIREITFYETIQDRASPRRISG